MRPEDLAELQRRLAQRFDAVGIDGLQFRDFRDVPLGFWHGTMPLERHANLFESFLDRLKRHRLNAAMRRLVSAFLDRYPTQDPTFGRAAEFIASELPKFSTPFLALGSDWDIFVGKRSGERLADAVLKSGTGVLTGAGLPEHLWSYAFVEHLFRQTCKRLQPLDPGQLANLKAWAHLSQARSEEALRFPRSRNNLMRALLGSWIGKPPPPDSPAKAEIMNLIDRVAGDPRTSTTGWIGVDDDLRKVYMQWLAEASLKQFLDIVERSLRSDADAKRMWKKRRTYWTAWFQTGRIDQAWVAFGRDAHADAGRVSAKDPNFGRSYAKVERSPTSYHSALIMRMGDHTIVEWSHSGKCWIWPNSRGAPRLDRRVYEVEDLREAPISIIHHDATWRQNVTEELRRLTGFSLPPHTWDK